MVTILVVGDKYQNMRHRNWCSAVTLLIPYHEYHLRYLHCILFPHPDGPRSTASRDFRAKARGWGLIRWGAVMMYRLTATASTSAIYSTS